METGFRVTKPFHARLRQTWVRARTPEGARLQGFLCAAAVFLVALAAFALALAGAQGWDE